MDGESDVERWMEKRQRKMERALEEDSWIGKWMERTR
jgi:hypothetical protein